MRGTIPDAVQCNYRHGSSPARADESPRIGTILNDRVITNNVHFLGDLSACGEDNF